MRVEYVPAFLFIPLVGRWIIYPLCRPLGRDALKLTSWVLLLFAFAALDPSNGKGHDIGAIGCLGASLLGFALMARLHPPIPPPRALTSLWNGAAHLLTLLSPRRTGARGTHTLATLCERRLGQPVLAATRMRTRTPQGMRVQAIALTQNHIFWLEHDPWRLHIGRVLAWRSLNGLAAHTAAQRFSDRQRLELSWPATCELFTGTLLPDADADRFVGQLTASQFQRTHAHGS